MFKSHRFVVGALFVLLLPVAFFAESAAARSLLDNSPPSARVQYGDLNLETPQGVASLYRRIRVAADKVCRSTEGPQLVNRAFWSEWHFCVEHAVAGAVQMVRNDNLSAYYSKQISGSKHHRAKSTAIASAQ
jgi:UrcA family protein